MTVPSTLPRRPPNPAFPAPAMNASQLQLVRENAQLETENRYLKQQLTQSHEVSRYLLGLLASNKPSPSSSSPPPPPPRSDRPRSTQDAIAKNPPIPRDQHDLMSFSDEDGANVTTPSLNTAGVLKQDTSAPNRSMSGTVAHRVPDADRRKSVGDLGVQSARCGAASGDDDQEKEENGESVGTDGKKNASDNSGDLRNEQRNPVPPHRVANSHAPRPSISAGGVSQRDDPSRHFSTTTPGWRRKLTVFPSDHVRLKNTACLIETMSEDEQTRHWQEYANSFPSHTAAEWETYYMTEIRPAYLQNCQSTAADAADSTLR